MLFEQETSDASHLRFAEILRTDPERSKRVLSDVATHRFQRGRQVERKLRWWDTSMQRTGSVRWTLLRTGSVHKHWN